MNINIKDSTIVRPAQKLPNKRLFLSNMDLLYSKYHVQTIYLYKPNGSTNFFETCVLKESLSKVLVPFYPVAGRLARDEKGRLEINCNGEGVPFIEAKADIAASDLGDFVPSLELRQLVPMIDYSGDISSYPFLVLQVTKFRCGSVSLGVGWNQNLADGTSALHFINSWSDIARGLSIAIPPIIDRTILNARVPPNSIFHHIEYDQPPTLITPIQNQSGISNSKASSISNMKITIDLLNTLKSKAYNRETKTKYSSFEILAAHIWRCASKARGLSDDQPTKLIISTDGRSRLEPPLQPGYFGNVVFQATPIASFGDLLSELLVDTVERIHKALKRMDDEYLRSAIDYLEEVDDLSTVIQSPRICQCPNLRINSWMRFPIYGADFGWGSPLLMRPAYASEGNGYLYPSTNNDGSFLFAICLEEDHMQSFQNIFYDF